MGADPGADPGSAARAAAGLPGYLARLPAGPYVSLNPLTKFLIAIASALVAFGLRGWTGPLVVLAASAAIALVAGVGRRLRRFLLAVIPLVASIILVNAFLYPGATDVLFRVGPLAATGTGIVVAAQATLRVAAFALSVAVFSLTTTTDDFLADLERRGTSRRLVFVVGSAITLVPTVTARAREIGDAQRSRGLDTEGSVRRRVRGLLPLAAPLVLGALAEVEHRTMALESRAFSAPARRTVLRLLPDSAAQRGVRWALGLGALAAVTASLAGLVTLP